MPSSLCSFSSKTLSTLAASLKSTNPNPRDLPVTGSVLIVQSTTSPNRDKYSVRSFLLVSQLKPPINILPSSCWFLLALILDPSANSSMLLYSFMSSIAADWSAGGCWRADRVAAAAAAERCMELDLKWRRKRSGRRLRPPFIAAPPANREGCWAVTWRWARRAPCRAELGASEGRSGASCRGARGRQWERLREAKVAGAEGNNGGGTWESRGGTSIAGLLLRSEVAGEGTRAWEERDASEEKQRRGEKSWGQNPEQRHSPSCLESLLSLASGPAHSQPRVVNPAFFRPRFPQRRAAAID